jgi:hypothetical protein
MAISGLSCYMNMTNLANYAYQFQAYATDMAGNMNLTETRYAEASVSAPPASEEIRITHSISPGSVMAGSSVAISVNVTTNGTLDSMILTITLPNSTAEAFQLSGNATMNYATSLNGLYNLTVFANTTEGKNSTVTGSFSAYENVNFNCTVTTYNGSGIQAKLDMYSAGTAELVYNSSSGSGSFLNQVVPEQGYDMVFRSYGDNLWVTLKNVNISQNLNRTVGFDNPPYSGYHIAYAVQNSYTLSSATVRLYYSGMDEDHIGLYRCSNWNFASRSCTGDWGSMSYSQNKNEDYVSFDVASFSAFFLRQETYCGDGICQGDEGKNVCPLDCDCASGETLECGSDVGECSAGELTCLDGRWSTDCVGSIGPATETCNGKDDNCNGVIDDVGGKNSVQATQCQCYNGQGPLSEELCNGIDDDCDGSIENNANCCTEGDTRACGTSLNTGACHPGTSTCSGGTWSQCSGAAFPAAEACNDLIDNDCDNLVDYSDTQDCRIFNQTTIDQTRQSACGNGVMDGSEYGVDCGGDCPPCFDYTSIWMTISIIGAAILGILVFMYFYLRRQGRELTWDELMKKWGGQDGYHYKAR